MVCFHLSESVTSCKLTGVCHTRIALHFGMLTPGLRRHKVVLINNVLPAEQYPGAQLYPACVQVEVTGNGTAFPTSFVSFPGAYTPDTPGTIPPRLTEKLCSLMINAGKGIIYDVWNGEYKEQLCSADGLLEPIFQISRSVMWSFFLTTLQCLTRCQQSRPYPIPGPEV
jgi:hypothetical protein